MLCDFFNVNKNHRVFCYPFGSYNKNTIQILKKNRFKLLSIILSYVFFVFVIVISINAVIPEKDLQVLEPQEILIKKVDNN